MYDPHTRESRGFGFVTMDDPVGAEAAIAALNATELKGRTMTVEKVGFMVLSSIPTTNIVLSGSSWPCSNPYPRPILRSSKTR